MKWILVAALIALAACSQKEAATPPALGGDAARGKQLVESRYNCTACHSIPGTAGPRGMVGPPLDHMAVRQTIGGKLQNTPQNMSNWLQHPQQLDPGIAMPDMNINEADARDITAFLYTLK